MSAPWPGAMLAEVRSGWHLTWQDPVAIALAVAGLALVWWLRRRSSKTDTVPLDKLSLSRRPEKKPPPPMAASDKAD